MCNSFSVQCNLTGPDSTHMETTRVGPCAYIESVLKCAFLTCGTQLISAGRVSSLLLCEHTQAYTSLCLLIAMSMWSFSAR
jgi:hypothetical protein